MKRKIIYSFLVLAMVLSMVVSTVTGCTTTTTTQDALAFPKDNYTVATKNVTTSKGVQTVTYHLYKNIVYVTNPVDANYECMYVSVPVKINGDNIDATNAPIFFNVNVGGYKSSSPIPNLGGLGGPPPGVPGKDVSTSDLALAAGYVVATPGCRGWDNGWVSGNTTIWYGKAPAAIVDLKCAVRYLHHNDDIMPGNANEIIATGGSAGGALSALLGASGDGDEALFTPYFEQLGAADASDSIFAAAPFCPIIDLEHADMAYEWMLGTTPGIGATFPGAPPSGVVVNQTLSQILKNAFTPYEASLDLTGKDSFSSITAANLGQYILQYYLIPSANKYLSALTDADRVSYLASHTWITSWDNTTKTASFSWANFVAAGGRMKGLPAFDAFNLSSWECLEFGNATTNTRHFTDFSLQYATGNNSATIASTSPDLPDKINMMNPMYFIKGNNAGCCDYWRIRLGTRDIDTSLSVSVNLATSLENLGKNVDVSMYWDGGHMANYDPGDLIAWIGNITGYTK